MGKQRIRNWIVSNPFFQTNGQFSKTAFICVTTWALVLCKFAISGLSLSYTKIASIVSGVAIPSAVITYAPAFDMSGSIALLTLVFGLYFGNKFTPYTSGTVTDNAEARKDIREDAAAAREEIRVDSIQARKDLSTPAPTQVDVNIKDGK